ncbi:MAG: DUF4097 domain-containing protein [Terriglobia bacterium]
MKDAKQGAVLLLLLGLAAVPAAGAEQETWRGRYPLPAGGQVEVVNIQGSIEVEGWDRSEVELVAIKTAEEEGQSLADVQVAVEAGPDSLRVHTLYRRKSEEPVRVDYRLRVPRQVRLEELRTVNGDVRVRNVEGTVEAHTLNGNIQQMGISGNVVAGTLNGDVKLWLRELPGPGGRVEMEAVNGDVFLRLPSDAHADLEVSTVAGRIESELLFSQAGEAGESRLRTRLGRGGVLIRLRTIRGSIRVVGGEDLL